MGQPFRFALKARHYEADDYGHLNHASYVHYLETARIEALEAIGLSLREMRRQGFLLLATEIAVKYHAPANPGDTLEISTHVQAIRGARTIWSQQVRHARSGRLVVSAEVTGAFVQEGGRAVRVPAAFRQRLAELVIPDPDRHAECRGPATLACVEPEQPAPAGDKECGP